MEEYQNFNLRESNEYSQASMDQSKHSPLPNTLYDITYDDDELDFEEGGTYAFSKHKALPNYDRLIDEYDQMQSKHKSPPQKKENSSKSSYQKMGSNKASPGQQETIKVAHLNTHALSELHNKLNRLNNSHRFSPPKGTSNVDDKVPGLKQQQILLEQKRFQEEVIDQVKGTVQSNIRTEVQKILQKKGQFYDNLNSKLQTIQQVESKPSSKLPNLPKAKSLPKGDVPIEKQKKENPYQRIRSQLRKNSLMNKDQAPQAYAQFMDQSSRNNTAEQNLEYLPIKTNTARLNGQMYLTNQQTIEFYDKKLRAERFRQEYLKSKDESDEITQALYGNMINSRYDTGVNQGEIDDSYGKVYADQVAPQFHSQNSTGYKDALQKKQEAIMKVQKIQSHFPFRNPHLPTLQAKMATNLPSTLTHQPSLKGRMLEHNNYQNQTYALYPKKLIQNQSSSRERSQYNNKIDIKAIKDASRN